MSVDLTTVSPLIWAGALAAVCCATIVYGTVRYVKSRRILRAKERLRRQIQEANRPSAPLFNHPQFSMMKSNSIPFIPVTLSPATLAMPGAQSKIYDIRPPAQAVHNLYRTPSQSSRYPKFNIINER